MDAKPENIPIFPDGRNPLGSREFSFACSAELSCFRSCCRKLEMVLYPYDILRLKNRLGIDSEAFLQQHIRLGQGSHPYFPAVLMNMADSETGVCPFLDDAGCTVYPDRPTACRTYPLERAVDRRRSQGRLAEYYFLTDHAYCLGHRENQQWTVKEWLRDQQILAYNAANDLWAEVDTVFAANPWRGEGAAGPKQQLAFMTCYNIDGFRRFVEANRLLSRFRLDKARKRLIQSDDEALMKFGFDWLKHILAGLPSVQPK